MNKYRVLIICLLFGLNLRGQGQTWREIPYYLKGYEVEYAKSPKMTLSLIKNMSRKPESLKERNLMPRIMWIWRSELK